ncbi:annexin-like protein RJ4 [Malania oleifera]|uniref:annexin-like protein RJ4 n=1 Tax=Malania oleifera TaxID=397392 RepID=UPI0025ADD66B|nr:annexin-like protein RJ4 [Malania oleifera]
MATLITPQHSSPVEDADALHKACEGWGTDEKAVISILGHRNATQRKLIRHAYEDRYQEDLIHRLEKELKGDLEKAMYRWILDPAERDAVLANVAITKSVDYHVIVEIACVYCPEELLAVRRAYQSRYKRSLEEDVASHTTGAIRKLLVNLVSAYRYDGNEINTRLAKSEAEILHGAIKEKDYYHEEIVRVLSTRSKLQVTATLNHYREAYGITINKDLAGNPSDKYLEALRTATRCINDPKKYYEKVLRTALNKSGNDDDALTRVIVTRAERDLREIKELYFKRNTVALEQAVAKETSGDYKAFLLTLLGKED